MADSVIRSRPDLVAAGGPAVREMRFMRAMRVRPIALLPLPAWLAIWLLSRSPHAYLLGHEVLGERTFSPPVATLLFGVGWLLMVVATMLPGALPAVARLAREAAARPAPPTAPRRVSSMAAPASFIAAYLAVWLLFGFAFAFGDLMTHAYFAVRYPHAAALLPGVSLLVAGVWQLLPRFVTAGDRGHEPRPSKAGSPRASFLAGWGHGLRCLRSCWALMLAMNAVGHGSPAVMALFALAMSLARRERRVSTPALAGP